MADFNDILNTLDAVEEQQRGPSVASMGIDAMFEKVRRSEQNKQNYPADYASAFLEDETKRIARELPRETAEDDYDWQPHPSGMGQQLQPGLLRRRKTAEVAEKFAKDFPDVSWDKIQPDFDRMLEAQKPAAMVDYYREQYKEGNLKSGSTYWAERIPVAGQGLSAAKSLVDSQRFKFIEDRVKNGTATEGDYAQIGQKLAEIEKASEATFRDKVGDLTTMLPGFAAEFMLTGDLYSLGKEAIASAATKYLSKSAATSALGQAAGWAGGTVVQAGLGMPGRTVASAAQRMTPQMALDAENSRLFIESPDKGWPKAMQEGLLDTVIEVGSERLGFIPGELASKAGLGKLIPKGLANLWAAGGRSTAALSKVAASAGWNGAFGEVFEELIGDEARKQLGLQDQTSLREFAKDLFSGSKPAWDRLTESKAGQDLAAMFVSFMIPGAAMGGVRLAAGRFSKENIPEWANKPKAEQIAAALQAMEQEIAAGVGRASGQQATPEQVEERKALLERAPTQATNWTQQPEESKADYDARIEAALQAESQERLGSPATQVGLGTDSTRTQGFRGSTQSGEFLGERMSAEEKAKIKAIQAEEMAQQDAYDEVHRESSERQRAERQAELKALADAQANQINVPRFAASPQDRTAAPGIAPLAQTPAREEIVDPGATGEALPPSPAVQAWRDKATAIMKGQAGQADFEAQGGLDAYDEQRPFVLEVVLQNGQVVQVHQKAPNDLPPRAPVQPGPVADQGVQDQAAGRTPGGRSLRSRAAIARTSGGDVIGRGRQDFAEPPSQTRLESIRERSPQQTHSLRVLRAAAAQEQAAATRQSAVTGNVVEPGPVATNQPAPAPAVKRTLPRKGAVVPLAPQDHEEYLRDVMSLIEGQESSGYHHDQVRVAADAAARLGESPTPKQRREAFRKAQDDWKKAKDEATRIYALPTEEQRQAANEVYKEAQQPAPAVAQPQAAKAPPAAPLPKLKRSLTAKDWLKSLPAEKRAEAESLLRESEQAAQQEETGRIAEADRTLRPAKAETEDQALTDRIKESPTLTDDQKLLLLARLNPKNTLRAMGEQMGISRTEVGNREREALADLWRGMTSEQRVGLDPAPPKSIPQWLADEKLARQQILRGRITDASELQDVALAGFPIRLTSVEKLFSWLGGGIGAVAKKLKLTNRFGKEVRDAEDHRHAEIAMHQQKADYASKDLTKAVEEESGQKYRWADKNLVEKLNAALTYQQTIRERMADALRAKKRAANLAMELNEVPHGRKWMLERANEILNDMLTSEGRHQATAAEHLDAVAAAAAENIAREAKDKTRRRVATLTRRLLADKLTAEGRHEATADEHLQAEQAARMTLSTALKPTEIIQIRLDTEVAWERWIDHEYADKPKTAAALKDMRHHIDEMTRLMVASGMVEEDMETTYIHNQGIYLHRSYRGHDVRDRDAWIAFLKGQEPEARSILNNAFASLKKTMQQYGPVQDEDVDAQLWKLIQNHQESAEAIMQARQDLGPEVRRAMGEYHDPVMNYQRTIEKMVRAYAGHLFAVEVRREGLGEFFFEKPTKNDKGDFTINLRDALRPSLQKAWGDLYGNQETFDALKAVYGPEAEPGPMTWITTFMKAAALTRIGKTALSPTAWVGNTVSGLSTMWGNGFSGKTYKTAWDMFRNDTPQNREEWLRLLKAGLGRGMSYEALRDIANDPWLSAMIQRAGGMMTDADVHAFLKEAAEKGYAFALTAYKNQDVFHQIAHYYANLERYAPLGEKQAHERAVQVTLDTYQNYARLPDAIKKLNVFAGSLLGDFMAFRYESVRNASNSLLYAIEDMKTPGLKAAGWARFISIATSTLVPWTVMAALASRLILGVGGDDDDAVRDLGPDFDTNGDIMYLRPLAKGVAPVTVDLSRFNYYSYLRKPLTAFLRDGDKVALKTRLERTKKELLGTLDEPAIFLKAADEAFLRGETDRGKSIVGWDAKLGHVWGKAIEPGFVTSGRRLLKASQGGDPGEIAKEAASFLVRPYEVDPHKAFRYRMVPEFRKALKQAELPLRALLKSDNPIVKTAPRIGTGPFGFAGGLREIPGEDELAKVYAATDEGRHKAFIEMRLHVNSARAMGMEDREIRSLLKELTVPGGQAMINDLMNGRYRPYVPPKGSALRAYKLHRAMGGDVPLADFLEKQRAAKQLSREQE